MEMIPRTGATPPQPSLPPIRSGRRSTDGGARGSIWSIKQVQTAVSALILALAAAVATVSGAWATHLIK